jgi:hypothetical protein
MPDVGAAADPRRDAARRREAARDLRGNGRIAPVRFLEQQDEMLHGLAASEFPDPQSPDDFGHLPAADMHVPRQDGETIDNRHSGHIAERLQQHRTNRVAPSGERIALPPRLGLDPPHDRIRRHDLPASTSRTVRNVVG